MPTLFRFVVILAVLAGLIYAGLWGIVLFVDPPERDMVQPVPLERLQKAP